MSATVGEMARSSRCRERPDRDSTWPSCAAKDAPRSSSTRPIARQAERTSSPPCAAVDAFRATDTEPYGVNQADAASHLAFIEEQGCPSISWSTRDCTWRVPTTR